jgi:hypothetical protein
MSAPGVGVIALASWTAEAGAPIATLIGAPQRRETSLLTRMAAHVLGELAERAGVELSTLATVYATRHGQLGATVELLARMHDGRGASSTMRLGTSLHDAAADQISAATGDRAFSTTVAAGSRTVAMGLLEAIGVLDHVASEVALVFVEEAVPQPLAAGGGYDGLAAALLLRMTDDAPWFLDDLAPRSVAATPRIGVPAPVAANPCSPALALVEAMRRGCSGPVALEAGEDRARRARWCVDVRSGAALA